ncbi:hypothetical protein F5888DRAFT_1631844 [Russula emetica]|nr:hypothetical protein F5888DRAFT_1631844 [Russula emetica]
MRNKAMADSRHGPCRTLLGTTVLGSDSAAEHALPGTHGPSRTLSALVSALVDPPNSSNGSSRSPGACLSTAFFSVLKTGFGCDASAPVNLWSKPYPDDVGVYIGLTVDDAGFGAGPCSTFVDPGSDPGGAELDDACASGDSMGFHQYSAHSSASLSNSESRSGESGGVDDGFDGSLNGFELAVDKAGFSVGACFTFIDPWSGPGGAELDDACVSDDSTGFRQYLAHSSASLSKSESRSGESGGVDDGFDGSLNGFGLVVDKAGLSIGACSTFIDPWLGPGSTELDDACVSEDSTGFCQYSAHSSASLSNSESRSGESGGVDDGSDGSLNGFGLAVDKAGFSVGACSTFIDPWLGPGSAEFDDACASDDPPRFRQYSSISLMTFDSDSAEGDLDDGLDGSLNGFGLAVDNAGFSVGACTTLVDPGSGLGCAELTDRLLRQLDEVFVPPLPQHSYHVSGYMHHIDACFTFLLYQYRSRESEVDDGKDEKDSKDYVVPLHFCWMLRRLDDVEWSM